MIPLYNPSQTYFNQRVFPNKLGHICDRFVDFVPLYFGYFAGETATMPPLTRDLDPNWDVHPDSVAMTHEALVESLSKG
jgi:hypothetical protein